MARKIPEEVAEDIQGELRGGRVGTCRDIRRYAIELGYSIENGGCHYKVFNGECLVCTLPNNPHKRISRGTYRKALGQLLDGLSS